MLIRIKPRNLVSLNWETSEASRRTRVLHVNTFLEILPSSSGSSLKYVGERGQNFQFYMLYFFWKPILVFVERNLGVTWMKENSWWVPATIWALCKNCRSGSPTFYIRRQEVERPKYIQDHTSRKCRHWSLKPVQQEYEFSYCCLTTPGKK